MIHDARSVGEGRRIEAEVCIVGAGPAGLTVARELARTGISVCLLESGVAEPDPEIQALARGDVTGLPYDALPSVRDPLKGTLELTRARRFGGTSTMWNLELGLDAPAVRLRRLEPEDLAERDCVPYSGWPFGMDELLPFYERAEAIFGLRSPADDHDAAPAEGARLLSADGPFEARLFRFGSRSVFTDAARSEVEHSTEITAFVGATVTRLDTDSSGQRVTSVRVETLGGNAFEVEASVCVLAAGGIENARLLLVSDRAHGIGNEHDLVGRFFMEHPHVRTGAIIPADTEALRSLPADGIRLFGEQLVETRLALRPTARESERLLDAVLTLIPMPASLGRTGSVRVQASPGVRSLNALRTAARERRWPDEVVAHLRNIASAPGDVFEAGVAGARRRVRRRLASPTRASGAGSSDAVILEVDAMSEQAPDPGSRVMLSTEVDAFNVRTARVHWSLSSLDLRTLVRTHDLLEDEVERAGLGKGSLWLDRRRLPPRMTGGHHHMGTTRMHRQSRNGVVDENCRVHEMGNLFVAGSSVFPTSGSANPTLTLVALSTRLADHLSKELRASPRGGAELEASRRGVVR